MNLYKAHNQWSTRPADERFESVQALYDATKAYYGTAAEATVSNDALRVEAIEGDVQLVGKTNVPAKLTHWAFGQMAARVGAPAGYLRSLPATLAVQNINHGMKASDPEKEAQLLFHQNGSLVLRAMTSDRYARIWNHEVAERLLHMEADGWEPAVPDFNAFDGTTKSLYASDHDMFAFMRFSDKVIAEPGTTEPMWRGVIVENSEVGASALKMTRFLYRKLCGNHIIWDTKAVCEVSLRHVGSIRERWNTYAVTAKKWADESASEDEAMIERAMRTTIAGTKEDVLDALFGKRSLGLTRKTLEAGYDAVVPDQDGSPNTAWGIVQGLTRHSQTTKFTDDRTAMDRAAGKILTIAF